MDTQQQSGDDASKEKIQHTMSTDRGDATELSKAQAKRLLLKTDLVVMPLAVLSMTLAFLDKVNRFILSWFRHC